MQQTSIPSDKTTTARQALDQILRAATAPGFFGRCELHLVAERGRIVQVRQTVERKH